MSLSINYRSRLLKFARGIGRKLPIPISLKARLRKLLLNKLYPARASGKAVFLGNRLSVSDNASILYEPHNGNLRPECSNLKPGLVSIVLPVYNQANLITESIESVLAQTYANFELIIINDGSSDSIADVLEPYGSHPKIKCFNQSNQRLPKALSNGFSVASGEYWTWTSADNIMEPRMLERLVVKLQANPGLAMTYADYYAIDDRGHLLQDPSWRAHNRPQPESAEIRLPRSPDMLNHIQDNFIGPCFMYRGWVGQILRDYDPQLGVEDYDYWMRINAFFKIDHLGSNDLLYRYRVHDNTLSANAKEHRIFEKVKRLMDYEVDRSRFYSKPFAVSADAACYDWLNAAAVSSVSIGALFDPQNNISTETAQRNDLLVLSSYTVSQHLEKLLALTTPIAILFSPDDNLYQQVQALLQQPGCIALVASPKVAARVRLVSKAPIIDSNSTQTFQALRAFSKNHRFILQTRTKEEFKRDLPELLLKPAGKHILLQVDSFTQGGMENVVIDLALALETTGFKVTIGNLGKSGDMVTKARSRGLNVEEFPKDFSENDYLCWLKQNGVTLVNAHYSIFAAKNCHENDIPFIETIHNAYVWFDEDNSQRYRNADPFIKSYLCVSNTAALYADVVLGLDVNKMRVIPNGIDSQNVNASDFESNRRELRKKWHIDSNAPVFLNVASIMATKAQLPLIKAFAEVVRQRPDARLILLGSVMEKPYQNAIEKTIKHLNLQKHVILAGYHREVAPFYHAADVFVLPSYWEGWSLSLGEAMANGLACVITNVGSAYEFAGKKGVKVIEAPFGEITQLNYQNLGDYVYGENDAFKDKLAIGMIEIFGEISQKTQGPNLTLAKQLDSHRAYKKYSEVFLSFS